MRRLLSLIIGSIIIFSCEEKSISDKQEESVDTDTIKKELTYSETNKNKEPEISQNTGSYIDKGEAFFEILSGNPENGFDFQSVETTYKLAYISANGDYKNLKNYIAKFISKTKSCTGCEGQSRKIKVGLYPFDNPKDAEIIIEKECDNIELNAHNYKATKYGCCAEENELGLFDYNHNTIINADNEIILSSIPNSGINMYFGFKKEIKDSDNLGTFFISYNSSEKYAIKIKTNKQLKERWTGFSPTIKIETDNPNDRFSQSENEYTFWSLDKVSSKILINGLTIKLDFDFGQSSKLIEIPIIEGKPFGKDIKAQEIIIE